MAVLVTDPAKVISGADRDAAARLGGTGIIRQRTAAVLDEVAKLVLSRSLQPFVTATYPAGPGCRGAARGGGRAHPGQDRHCGERVNGQLSEHPLDNPARSSLTGPHAHLAERRGRLLRYPPDVSPWLAMPDDPGPDDWADVAALAGPGGSFSLAGSRVPLPEGWEAFFHADGVQLVQEDTVDATDDEAVRLGPADVPEMLDLVERTRPGPFLERTVELGTYLGIRRDGMLVAMAGERMRPPGWTEISAVCTAPEYRGQGLADTADPAVAAGIRARGETPFLHAAADNAGALRLYESFGFRLRRKITFIGATVPGRPVRRRGPATDPPATVWRRGVARSAGILSASAPSVCS